MGGGYKRLDYDFNEVLAREKRSEIIKNKGIKKPGKLKISLEIKNTLQKLINLLSEDIF